MTSMHKSRTIRRSAPWNHKSAPRICQEHQCPQPALPLAFPKSNPLWLIQFPIPLNHRKNLRKTDTGPHGSIIKAESAPSPAFSQGPTPILSVMCMHKLFVPAAQNMPAVFDHSAPAVCNPASDHSVMPGTKAISARLRLYPLGFLNLGFGLFDRKH